VDFTRTRHEHADLDAVIDHGDAGPGPEDAAVTRQEMDMVGAALAALTDDQREAIELRFFAGLSASEAADVMGRKAGTIRGLQFRAIAALRRHLGMHDMDTNRPDEPLDG
jgi:RNA polymerase sigma-70 factor (ECF subfamily)